MDINSGPSHDLINQFVQQPRLQLRNQGLPFTAFYPPGFPMIILAHFRLTKHISESYGNASQPYSFSRASRKALHEARVIIADCIGASPEEIYFTSGGTESDNWAIRGAKKSGKGIITSAIEHHAVLYSCALYGNEVLYLKPDKYGGIDSEILKQKISSETGLVSIMLANNEIGTIEPVADLAKLAHDKGAIFHTDAVQAIGHIPIDVEALGVDLLSASDHKFNGPKGVGFLYVRKGTEIESFMRGGSQESGMRAGTENVASIAAMAVALRNNCADMEVISNRLCHLEETLLEELNKAGIDFVSTPSALGERDRSRWGKAAAGDGISLPP